MTIDDAALQVSYAIEGVKDQRAINLMVAALIVSDATQYANARVIALTRFPGLPRLREAVAMLDLHHDPPAVVQSRVGCGDRT